MLGEIVYHFQKQKKIEVKASDFLNVSDVNSSEYIIFTILTKTSLLNEK